MVRRPTHVSSAPPMDELGTALGWVSELLDLKRVDASAASIPRLKDSYLLPARASSPAVIRPAAPAPMIRKWVGPIRTIDNSVRNLQFRLLPRAAHFARSESWGHMRQRRSATGARQLTSCRSAAGSGPPFVDRWKGLGVRIHAGLDCL